MNPTLAGTLADAVVAVHLVFITVAVFGGLATLRWPRLAFAHLPALAWAAWVTVSGQICPLTPIEQDLRALAGGTVYAGGFVDHYLAPLIYPPGLTRAMQVGLGLVLLAGNAGVYSVSWRRRRRARSPSTQARSATT